MQQLQQGKMNFVVDGQWGSCGKGLINTALADRYRPSLISTTNMANAGHTCITERGKFIAKILPTSAWLTDHFYKPLIYIGATAGFTPKQLGKEIHECGIDFGQLVVHPRAGVITQRHKDLESQQAGDLSTKHIASTMQGCGAMLVEKISRSGMDVIAAGDHQVRQLAKIEDVDLVQFFENRPGVIGLHEGSQGFSLSLNHGSHYPYCTSRDCTAVQMLSDLGLTPKYSGEVIMVVRPFPIRVGNVVENGETLGFSGGCYQDQQEMTWEEVAESAGAPSEIAKGELTTVTGRLRRVFSFSPTQFVAAVRKNGATQIALNFANYIDWSCYKCNDWDQLPERVVQFINYLEMLGGVPVTMVGTGPCNEDVCWSNQPVVVN